MSQLPRVCLVSPASAADNNGNWHTAARWRDHLTPLAEVRLLQHWDGQDAELMIALHARRSAAAVAGFRQAFPARPVALVLTGTDVYRDLASDAAAQNTVALAERLVCLQPRALDMLAPAARAKACVIVQGAQLQPAAGEREGFVAVGHLRAEKDPLTLMRAARRGVAAPVSHIGAPLDAALAAQAQATMAAAPGYAWLGALPHAQARERIAGALALVHMSRLEGGANVVIEAICSGTPVLASRIAGNTGLLGEDYGGYFPVGDDAALAALMARCLAEPAFLASLRAQCERLAPRYSLEAEAQAVRALLPRKA